MRILLREVRKPIVVLAHGSATAGPESFDVQVEGRPRQGEPDFSLMDYLAREGFDVFAADAHPQQPGRKMLLTGHRCPAFDRGFHRTKTRRVSDDLQRSAHGIGLSRIAVDLESYHAAKAPHER